MQNHKKISQFFIGFLAGIFVISVFLSGAVASRITKIPLLDKFLPLKNLAEVNSQSQRIVSEESVVTDVAESASPAVVTVSLSQSKPVMEQFFLDPFGVMQGQRPSGGVETQQVDIGTGFVVDKSGLVVTNKHVVMQGDATLYKIILKDNSEHQVQKIWRDPSNDLAILKIEGNDFTTLELGDSDTLKVGNFVIAIGTALGEFRHTVTTGVVSGLGRGITAGEMGGGIAEKLDNVIQTDAAINPGNSGGPLINSSGQVIGVNVAVSQSANNIGFALPINVLKDALNTFNTTGQFNRPFLGVKYKLVTKEAAVLNDVPAGAYVMEVIAGSSAEKAGIKIGDIITVFDGQKVIDVDGGLPQLVGKKKVGDNVVVEIYRDKQTSKLTINLLVQE
ncbi:MAG: trypsin-like peptidase domain-containing protein [bacterium]